MGSVTTSMAPMPRRGGLALAGALACVLGCAGRQAQAPRVPSAAARVSSGAPSVAASSASSSAAAPGAGTAPAAAGADDAAGEGATLPAPPSGDEHNVFGLVQSAGDLAKQGSNRVASPDGERVVFVQPAGPQGKPSLWVSRKDGSEARKLVDVETTQVENPHRGSPLGDTSGIFDLSFSPDGKKVYFLADGWVTSLALYVVELDGGKLRFVHDALGYTVIRACTDKKQVGRLITLRHSYFDPIPTSAVNWYFLLDEQGKQLGIVGPEPENVERYMARRCGVGVAPRDPPKTEVPPRLRAPRHDCDGHVVKRNPIQFLDGTGLELFFVFDKESLKTEESPSPYDVLSLSTAELYVDSNCPVPVRKKR